MPPVEACSQIHDRMLWTLPLLINGMPYFHLYDTDGNTPLIIGRRLRRDSRRFSRPAVEQDCSKMLLNPLRGFVSKQVCLREETLNMRLDPWTLHELHSPQINVNLFHIVRPFGCHPDVLDICCLHSSVISTHFTCRLNLPLPYQQLVGRHVFFEILVLSAMSFFGEGVIGWANLQLSLLSHTWKLEFGPGGGFY